jgi:membrane fusion protein (multidrug efflux system)
MVSLQSTFHSPQSMGRNIKAGIFCFLFFVFSFISGCTQKQEDSRLNVLKEEVIPVKVVKVELQDIAKTLDYVGSIKARDEAQIYPKVSGKIIEKLKEESARVNKGDTIMYIDRDEVGFTFEKAPVESPLRGIIGRVYVDKGMSVTPQTPLALVVDIENVKIKLEIPEEYVPKLNMGQDAEINIDAYPEEKFRGKVSKISPVIESDTRSVPIEILVPNVGYRLKPGMFARVKLVLEEHKQVPVILKEAIIGKEPSYYVYIVNNQAVSKRPVKLGLHKGPYYEVVDGLKQDDIIVIMGQQRLFDGAAVRTEER